MKIAIVGRHPDLEIGFNGLMSKNWILGFASFGVNVDLVLPKSSSHDPVQLMKNKGIDSLDKLDAWGTKSNFFIFDGTNYSLFKSYDCVIWQSYRPEEDYIREELKRMDLILAKNPPRVFSGLTEKDKHKAKGLTNQFDVVGLSLHSDYMEAASYQEYFDSFYYVPRGFDTELLGSEKKDSFIIGLDKAVRGEQYGNKSIQHIIDSGVNVKNHDISFYSLRNNIEELNSKRIPLLDTVEFYKQFLNKISIYMPINFDYSVHSKGRVTDRFGNHRYLGLYENQIVEAQLAGAIVITRSNDIPEELIMYNDFSVVDDYSDVDRITKLILDNYHNISVRSKMVRDKARAIHSIENSARSFYSAICEKMSGK